VKQENTITGAVMNDTTVKFAISLPLPDLVRAIIVALQHLGIEVDPPDVNNEGEQHFFSIFNTVNMWPSLGTDRSNPVGSCQCRRDPTSCQWIRIGQS